MLLDYGAFSGPSRLGPIADAIARSTARAAALPSRPTPRGLPYI